MTTEEEIDATITAREVSKMPGTGVYTIIKGGHKVNGMLAKLQRVPNQPISISVGIHDGVKNKKGVSLPAIAYINEFGSNKKNIPARPFMRTATDKFKRDVLRHSANPFRKLDYDNVIVSLKWSLQHMGVQFATLMRKEIREFSKPPNAPSTIKRKGFDDPLIHNKDLYNAIEWRWAGSEAMTKKMQNIGE